MGNDTDRRALVAITLCIAVYFFWMSLFPPPAPVAPVDGPGLNEAGEPLGEAPEVSSPDNTPAVEAEAPAPTINVPEHSVALNGTKWVGEIHSDEGAIRALDMTSYTEASTVTPIYSWLLDGMDGSFEA